MAADKSFLAALRDALSQLPDAEYQDIKGIWETGDKLTGGSTNNADDQPDPVRRQHPRPPVVLPLTGASQRLDQRPIPTVGAVVQASSSVGAPCHHWL